MAEMPVSVMAADPPVASQVCDDYLAPCRLEFKLPPMKARISYRDDDGNEVSGYDLPSNPLAAMIAEKKAEWFAFSQFIDRLPNENFRR